MYSHSYIDGIVAAFVAIVVGVVGGGGSGGGDGNSGDARLRTRILQFHQQTATPGGTSPTLADDGWQFRDVHVVYCKTFHLETVSPV